MAALQAATIEYLATDEGAALLAEAARIEGDTLRRLSVLRRSHPADLCAAAVDTLELRARAAARFSEAHRMFFTSEGLEQATSEAVARWRAARFPAGMTVADLCCGIGGDALALAERAQVVAIDLAPEAVACVRANAAALGLCHRIEAALGDVTERLPRAEAAFIDPSRRRMGRRVRDAESYRPPLSFVKQLLRSIPDLAAKVSPAIDDAAIRDLPARVEFVSHRGECKEAVLWFGGIGPVAPRSASVLPAGACLQAAEPASDGVAPVGPLRAWLIEPDPAVIRAHLLPELCGQLGATAISPGIAYLTADAPPRTPFATAYRVVEAFPLSLRAIQQRLRARDRRAAAVKKRGVPHDAEELASRLPPHGSAPTVVVLTRVAGKPTAILCDPAGLGASAGE